jgi:hypothetical protein
VARYGASDNGPEDLSMGIGVLQQHSIACAIVF